MASSITPPISFISLILLIIFSIPAGAATFTVTNLNDSGAGSLRQAILDAKNATGDDTIIFQTGLSGSILLTNGALQIDSNLTINGPGAKMLVIDGNGLFSGPFKTLRVIEIAAGVTVTLNGLTIRGGATSCGPNPNPPPTLACGDVAGGGIINKGVLTVSNSIVTENMSAISGAGILNSGTLTFSNSILSNNQATDSAGLLNDDKGVATVLNSTISGNKAYYPGGEGGGITNYGSLTVRSSTISGNVARGDGGGIENEIGSVIVINSTISGNFAVNGGGISNGGLQTFDDKIKLWVLNSTISGNVASNDDSTSLDAEGGGIYNQGIVRGSDEATAIVLNSTITGNVVTSKSTDPSATFAGGGIFNGRNAHLSIGNSLVSGNSAKVAKEIASASDPNFTDANFLGHNILGENGNAGVVGLVNASTGTDWILPGPVSTAIGSLASNGGPTQTHLPQLGGPLINNGDNSLIPQDPSTNQPIATDQRSAGYPRIVNGTVDIGAVEAGAGSPPSLALAGLTSTGQVYYTTNLSTWVPISGQLAQLQIGDLNGDGQPDLAGLAGNGTVWYTPNLSTWTNVPGGLAQLRVGDLNGDGKADLAGLASNGSIWYTTNLTTWTQVPGGLAQLRVSDFNGDGKADLAGLASNGSIWYTTNLTTWTQVPGGLAQLRVGDFNGDGKADLAGLASNGSIWYTTNLTTWTQVPGGLAQLQVGDLNGDGHADLAGLASNGSIWYTTNLTTWTQVPGALSRLVVRDLNGDGHADLAGLASNGSIWYTTNLSAWTQIPGQLNRLAGDD